MSEQEVRSADVMSIPTIMQPSMQAPLSICPCQTTRLKSQHFQLVPLKSLRAADMPVALSSNVAPSALQPTSKAPATCHGKCAANRHVSCKIAPENTAPWQDDADSLTLSMMQPVKSHERKLLFRFLEEVSRCISKT